jgi:sec-independent protein translocase protein TatB
MFGLGMGELLVILAVALLVLGPKRLPDLASGLGKAIREFRKATSDLQSQLEVDESVSQPLAELKSALRGHPAPLPKVTSMPPPAGVVAHAPVAVVAPTSIEPAAAPEAEPAAPVVTPINKA